MKSLLAFSVIKGKVTQPVMNDFRLVSICLSHPVMCNVHADRATATNIAIAKVLSGKMKVRKCNWNSAVTVLKEGGQNFASRRSVTENGY